MLVQVSMVMSVLPATGRSWESNQPKPLDALYRRPEEPIHARVQDLLSRMSTKEKIAQLLAPYNKAMAEKLSKSDPGRFGSLGWLNFMGVEAEPYKVVNMTLAEMVTQRNAAQRAELERSRLHIPAAFYVEGLHGAGAGLTVFPMPWNLGASWNTSLVGEVAATVAAQARAIGADILFAPVLNLFTDARFGRYEEGFSPDPVITAQYAQAAAYGYQGGEMHSRSSLAADKVLAVAKHYAAYGAAAGGLNAAPAEISERTLLEVYLAPWRSWSASGGHGAMLSHQTVNRIPMHANTRLVNLTLRNKFGFGEGVVISDCNDVGNLRLFNVAPDDAAAAAMALRAGLDLDLVCESDAGFSATFPALQEALKQGLTTMAEVDRATGRVLAAKFAAGLFEQPLVDEQAWQKLDLAYARRLAYEAVLESMVVLRGRFFAKPFDFHAKRIAVLGPNGGCGTAQHGWPGASLCNAQFNMLGGYANLGSPAPEVHTVHIAMARACAAAGGPACTVHFARGAEIEEDIGAADLPEALEFATTADVVVLVLGDDLSSCAEDGDRDSLVLPGYQLKLLKSIAERLPTHGVHLLVVLIGGRPVTFGNDFAQEEQLLSRIDALLVAGRPGEQGGVAIADVIFHRAKASGRLAAPWPRGAGQLGAGGTQFLQERNGKWIANSVSTPDLDGRVYHPYWHHAATPLFALGEGGADEPDVELSKFSARSTGYATTPLEVLLSVRNPSSQLTVLPVVQVYLQDPVLPLVRYWKRLAAFKKLRLAPEQTVALVIPVTFDMMAFYDEDMQWLIPAGNYTVRVGLSSRTDELTTIAEVRHTVCPASQGNLCNRRPAAHDMFV